LDCRNRRRFVVDDLHIPSLADHSAAARSAEALLRSDIVFQFRKG
jgi:hypothetical protein